MDTVWFNFALEIGFFSFLGVLYYFYQKRKILHFEENKIPLVMSFLLQASLSEKIEGQEQPEMDQVIEALDDYLNKKTKNPPLEKLKKFALSPECPADLSHAINEAMKEIE